MPVIIGLVVVAAVVAGYFAYTTFFQGPMSAADYKAQAIQYLGQMDTAATDVSGIFADSTSADAKAKFTSAATTMRGLSAKVRALRPPAEYRSLHTRLVAGLDAYETVLKAIEGALASGGDPSKAITDLQSSAGLETSMNDFTAAYDELKAGSTPSTGTTTP